MLSLAGHSRLPRVLWLSHMNWGFGHIVLFSLHCLMPIWFRERTNLLAQQIQWTLNLCRDFICFIYFLFHNAWLFDSFIEVSGFVRGKMMKCNPFQKKKPVSSYRNSPPTWTCNPIKEKFRIIICANSLRSFSPETFSLSTNGNIL